jgi:pimeloyl-ACP methyl ester carboxylesterase
MKFWISFLLMTAGFSARAQLNQTRYAQLKVADGSAIQVCTRYPDAKLFPGPRPVLMVLMGSGISDACKGKVGGGEYAEKILGKGIIIFARQKRGIWHDPQTGQYTANFTQYAKSDFFVLKSDTSEALDYVLKDPRVDRKKVGVWGISEGSILATHLGLLHPEIKELDLVSSVIEKFSSLYNRQIYKSLPHDLIQIYDRDKKGTLSSDEITNLFLVDSGLRTFKQIDLNHDGVLSEKEISTEIKRVVAEALVKNDDTFFLSKIGGSVSAKWTKSALSLESLRPQLLQLKMPTYLLHGTEDANTSIQPVYKLEKKAASMGKSNLRFEYFHGLRHQLSPEILVKSMMDAAERLLAKGS